MPDNLLGFHRLEAQHSVRLVQPLHTLSRLGAVRQRELAGGREIRTWTAQYQPTDTFRGHFEFGLKYERLNFEFFSRLFHCIDPEEVASWVREAPTGGYARRAGFFYEWFTGRQLAVPDTAPNVGYVDAMDASLYLAAQRPERNRRWRVNDNLPGTRDFCPMVHLGAPGERDWLYDVAAGVQALDDVYGPELLLRSAAWLTFKESRASFAIEHEADKQDRVKRFAAAIGEFSGRMDDPMSPDSLITLQRALLGDAALRVGIRRSPVFVGQSTFRAQIVHYIAPSEELVDGMLDALRSFEARTRGANALARAAAVSFAFVYLHPLADGNGRIHRFLVNHLLAADKAVPANIIVPVSATIAGSARGRAGYDHALEVFSRPFMRSHADGYRFGASRTCPDGVVTDFEFLQTEDAQHAWRYLDLSEHARYLSDVLRQTVEHEMAEEALALRRHDDARAAIKNLVEMPDQDADRIIRSLKEGNWQVSNKLRKELPEIFGEGGGLHAHHGPIVAAVRDAFEGADLAADDGSRRGAG
ncbi:filamentation induced by cAMP protein Fic [Delftia sp. Cs1-4]|uniref:Fic family protein n=1 Tax=Delftia sp. (strain Cs1-4) TaxID=742013 RepID=UPI00020E7A87|nr:Fic family protein [Delftia sp. Cs1-4]AEF88747.1 filamentation induced by cAMP protein Fic [Delftia sp. Cs1-4]